MKWRHWLGVLISVVCLWWALKGVSWSGVWSALRSAHLGWLVLVAVGSLAVGVFLRALRWRLFFPPETRLRPGALLSATGIGLMANNVLPARMGEFVRAYVLGRRTPVAFTTAFGSLFVERLFDFAVLTMILIAGVLLTEAPSWMEVLARVAGVVFLALLAVEVLLILYPGPVFRLLHATTGRFLPPRLEAGLEGALHRFIEGFQMLRDPRRIALALLLSFVFWLSNGALYYLGLLAFDLKRVGLGHSLIMQSVVTLGISIPSSPGFVGTFQAFVVKVLSSFGVDRDLAFSYSIGFHMAQYLPVTLFGLWLFWRANLSWGEIERSEERIEARLSDEGERLSDEAEVA